MSIMKLIERKNCTGCMACLQACSQNCISIEYDSFGSSFPAINNDKCIDCGACQRACPVLCTEKLPFHNGQHAYAVWSLDQQSRKSSASGGAASELYYHALKNDYWICGAIYDKRFQVYHIITQEKNDIMKFKQSKYVFSDTSMIYSQIRTKLDNGEKVLFISLPCKVAGLLSFLNKRYDNLITVDIVCHGTPPYKHLFEHISNCDKTQSASYLKFRDDNSFSFVLLSSSNKTLYSRIGRTDSYLGAFLEGLNYRENCYSCPYAKPERVSDITIGDFWGLGDEIPFEHPYTGSISLVMTNTEQGHSFFEACSSSMFVEERTVSEAVKGNCNLNRPSTPHKERDRFIKMYETRGFEFAANTILSNVIRKEKQQVKKEQLRQGLRKAAGVIIKRYRS